MKHEILNHTEYLFSAALKRSGNLDDAEDLTQEVLLAALVYQSRGGEISNMRAWLLSTLDHKWNDMLRKKYRLPVVSIDMVSDEVEEKGREATEEEAESDGPTAEQIRREVAYLAKLQREVIVRHYLQGHKVQRIADELNVPKGTVLSRLASGRKQMRKGLETMEQYEKQSYIPERLDISCNGCPGLHDEPWSLVSGDLMKQNILILAYEKPLTVVEIAKALGIPMPYIEAAVEDLVKSQLMRRSQNKVFTDFMMVTPEQVLKGLDGEIALADMHYEEIWACILGLFADVRNRIWYDKLDGREKRSAEYYAMLDVFSRGIYMAMGRLVDVKEECPNRPDGGNWIAQGSRYPAGFDFGSYRAAKYCYGGERRACWEGYLNAKSVEIHVYDTQPDLNKYEHGPVEMCDGDLCKLLYVIHQGISIEEAGMNPMYLEDIPHLAECGVLRYDNGQPRVAVPVIGKAQYEELLGLNLAHARKLADVLEEPLRRALPQLKTEIPGHLEGRVAQFRRYSCYHIPMAVVKRALAQGDFLRGVEAPVPPMLLVAER